MGKPAARIGDSTAHGGAIVAGAPTVLIGGMPAARMSDMHVCPMLNPGVPPPPHVGQQIILGSPMVLICGQMAARMGDMVMCSGPPDSILAGCPTVLIGEGGGGGGGAGPAGAATSAALAGGGISPEKEEGHFLDVTFVDKAGKPIKGVKYQLGEPGGNKSSGTLQGRILKKGVPQGSYEFTLRAVTSAKWSAREAKVGEKVKMEIETSGLESGTPAVIEIFMRDGNFSDQIIKKIDTKISGDKIKEEWEFRVDDNYLKIQREKLKSGGYSSPAFYFLVKAADVAGRSGLLRYHDFLEIKLLGDDGKPLSGKKFRLHLISGEVREGTLDSNGHAKIEKVPPGESKVKVEIR
jgi:uncharacterized Zn-binding protein involved in type VI secretion